MSEDGRTLTPAQIREQLRDATPLMPGVWRDRDGYLHFSVPEILAALEMADTLANRQAVADQIRRLIADQHPDATIVEQERES